MVQKKQTLDDAIIAFVNDTETEGSDINLAQMSAAYRAAQLVLETESPIPPTTDQIIKFAAVAQMSALQNTLVLIVREKC